MERNHYLFFIIIFLSLFFIHSEIITKDPLLNYDDNYVVSPMQHVTGVKDYISKIKSGEIYDLQPIRDVSFYLDFKIKKILHISPHHFINLIIWMSILIFLFLLLTMQSVSPPIAYVLVSLYAFHPCFANALLWATARKHLLSTSFTLFATYFILTTTASNSNKDNGPSNKQIFLISLFYFLSCFSQPINILWPIWVLALIAFHYKDSYKKLFNSRWLIMFSLLTMTLLTCAILNYFYYTTVYVQQSGLTKFIENADNQISFKLLIVGRSFWQAIIPFWSTPTSYYPGSVLNILGIILTVIVTWAIYKTKKKILFIWLLFSVLPILVITMNVTNIFGSDTYILNTGIGVFIIFGIIINDYSSKLHQRFFQYCSLLAALLLLLIFIYTTSQISTSWLSDYSLFERASNSEATPLNLKNYIQNLLKNGEYKKSFALANQLIDWDPEGNNVDSIYLLSVYKYPDLNNQDKISLLENKNFIYKDSPWLKYYLASLYASQKNFQKSNEIIESISESALLRFKEDSPVVLAEFIYFCHMANKNCLTIKNKFTLVKKLSKPKWDEQKFQTRLKSLNMDTL